MHLSCPSSSTTVGLISALVKTSSPRRSQLLPAKEIFGKRLFALYFERACCSLKSVVSVYTLFDFSKDLSVEPDNEDLAFSTHKYLGGVYAFGLKDETEPFL